MTLSITRINHYADCHILFIVVLNVIMLDTVMLSVVCLSKSVIKIVPNLCLFFLYSQRFLRYGSLLNKID